MKKKILVINNSHRISGGEVSLLSLLSSLGNTYDFTVIVPKKGDLYSKLADLNIRTGIFHLQRFSKAGDYFSKIKWFFQALSTAVKISSYARKHHFDLIYANSNQAIGYSILIRIFTGKRIIWHVRDNLRNKLIARILAWFSSKIICISDYIYEQIPAGKTKKFLVYNGIDCSYWAPYEHGRSIARELSLEKGTLLVGHAGQLIPWKNPLDFIKISEMVLKKFKLLHFLIIGDDLFNTDSPYAAMLKTLVKERNLEKHVTFLGYREDIRHCINQLDVLVHCATEEPFGRVVMEALALEKPVVAYRSGGIREIITDNETGLLSLPNSPRQLAGNLLLLLNDRELRERLGAAGRKEVCKRFPLPNMSLDIQKIIDCSFT